jgi:hypothetical protein
MLKEKAVSSFSDAMVFCYSTVMNTEKNFGEQHEIPEKFPSQEEIKSVFEVILQDANYKELRVLSNEQGVYLYEVEVALENGEKIEYNYQKATYNYRDTSLPPGAQFSASIHKTYYDVDGMPYGGDCVANYLDGTWHYLK